VEPFVVCRYTYGILDMCDYVVWCVLHPCMPMLHTHRKLDIVANKMWRSSRVLFPSETSQDSHGLINQEQMGRFKCITRQSKTKEQR
jgi:hypothetical protein